MSTKFDKIECRHDLLNFKKPLKFILNKKKLSKFLFCLLKKLNLRLKNQIINLNLKDDVGV